MSQYTRFKLSEIKQFTVNKVFGYDWVEWNNDTNTMKREKDWFQGAKKQFSLGVSVDGVQGYLSVSSSQLAFMLESVVKSGVADLNGVQFNVKTNGKEGLDIRYFINPILVGGATTGGTPVREKQVENDVVDEIQVDDVPF